MSVRFPFHEEVHLHTGDGATAVVLVTEMVVDGTDVALWTRADSGQFRELGIAGSGELPVGELEVELRPRDGVEVPRNAAAMRRALRRRGQISDADRWRIARSRPLA